MLPGATRNMISGMIWASARPGGQIFHGKKGELYQRYHEGMEDQLGALGLILNCVVPWNTRYISAALDALRAQGYPVLDEDVARSHRSSASTSTWPASTTSCSPTSAKASSASCATPTPPTTSCPTEPPGSVAACDGKRRRSGGPGYGRSAPGTA